VDLQTDQQLVLPQQLISVQQEHHPQSQVWALGVGHVRGKMEEQQLRAQLKHQSRQLTVFVERVQQPQQTMQFIHIRGH
jgi:hypothetical protein